MSRWRAWPTRSGSTVSRRPSTSTAGSDSESLSLRFFYPIERDAPETRRDTIQDYFSDLEQLCDSPVRTTVAETDDPQEIVDVAAADADVLVVSGSRDTVRERLFGHGGDSLDVDCDTVVVYGADPPGPLRRRLEEKLF